MFRSCAVRSFVTFSRRSLSSSAAECEWDRAVKEAERIVGYPTSFANLRWLMSDEVANVALHLRKLMGTDHPILQTAKTLLYEGKSKTQAWGLLMLLVSKAVGNHKTIDPLNENDVFLKQRTFAELTEIIKTGHMVHKSLINIRHSRDAENMVFGNKIALLTGDYLLATANKMLSDLKNQHLSELISSALRDLTEAEFVGERNVQNLPVPSKPITSDGGDEVKVTSMIGNNRKFDPLDTAECLGTPVREWTMRNLLNGASLLGRGCEGILHLAGHDQDVQDTGYIFGCHVALAWQASMDVDLFNSINGEPFSLVSAPMLFALQEDPSLYDEVLLNKDGNINYEYLRVIVKNNNSAMHKTMCLYHENSVAAVRTLESFPNNDATNALRKIIFCKEQ